MKNKFFLSIFISVLLIACTNNDVFLKYKTIPSQGWNKDSLYSFDVLIEDTAGSYNVYVTVRHRSEYPYQNVWLFLSRTLPDGLQTKDTIECYLSDRRGKWLGTGIGSVLEMPILYQQHVTFDKVGTYRYKIVHGMRNSLLIGINDIGMRVEKIDRQ